MGQPGEVLLHADERLVAEPDRVPVHGAEGVLVEQFGLPQSRGTPGGNRVVRQMAKRRSAADQAGLARVQAGTIFRCLSRHESHLPVTALATAVERYLKESCNTVAHRLDKGACGEEESGGG